MKLVAFVGVAGLGSFVVGAIPFGVIAGRLKGIDIRSSGSGNIGATNVSRLLGRRWGAAVFVLDLLKGLCPSLTAGFALQGGGTFSVGTDGRVDVCWLTVGLCAVLGHNYSPFLRFRGGKGVATSLGVALGVYPDLTFPALIAVAVWGIVVGVTRVISAGSVAAGLAFPVAYSALAAGGSTSSRPSWPMLAFTCAVAGMVLVRHRGNLARIAAGTEARIGDPGPRGSR